MPHDPRRNSLKDPELYDKLRKEGDSEEKAARISNAIDKEGSKAVGKRGGESGSYYDWTVPKLRARAKELGLSGYSHKSKSQLVDLLRGE